LTEQLQASSVYIKDGAVYTVTVVPKTDSVEPVVITASSIDNIGFASAAPI
jgi:hypothetical protein